MSNDNKVIGYLSAAELQALMRDTGLISIQETASADGKPVIHALLKVINAQTGVELPGGLPFSVVMFKRAAEAGYSNVAIGTVVPAAELGIELPADFFNLCNQRFRFIRAYPLDANSFVLQLDLMVHGATVEYVKFAFGLWASMFSQVLFELLGHGREAASRAAEIYARTPVTFMAPALDAVTSEPPAEEAFAEAAAETVSPAEEPEAEVKKEVLDETIVAEPQNREEPAAQNAVEAPPAEAEVQPETEVAETQTEGAAPAEAPPAEKVVEAAAA